MAHAPHALRLMPVGWNETWWVAGLCAAVAVVLAYQLESRCYGKPTWVKAQRVVVALVLLSVFFIVAMVAMVIDPRWTPEQFPDEFHALIGKKNYEALRTDPAADLRELRYWGKSFIPEGTNVRVPYFHDAWGKPMRLIDGKLVASNGKIVPDMPEAP